MPATRPTDRPLAVTAAWAGVASALVASIASIAVVAVVWLPASAGSGSAGSAIRAGILTFLAGVHGGVTVDGVDTAFVPLGLTLLAAAILWRAATAVAAAAENQPARRPGELPAVLLAQAGAYGASCGLLAALSPLGTSHASVIGAVVAGFVLAAVVTGAALVRTLAGDDLREATPRWVRAAARCATGALAVYLAAGALLVAAALVLDHDRVITLSEQVGGGWSGVPVLLLGVLAAPNAAIAGAAYLSGAGFAVGTGTGVGLTGATTGLVPAFPILGALPTGDGAGLPAWLLAAVTPLAAGVVVAVLAGRADDARSRWQAAGGGVALLALAAAVLGWQGGGGIGSGKLHVVGTSPWQFGGLVALWAGVAAASLLGARALVEALRERDQPDRPTLRETIAALTSVESYDDDDADEQDHDRGPDSDIDSDAESPAAGDRDPGRRKPLAG